MLPTENQFEEPHEKNTQRKHLRNLKFGELF